MNISEFKKKYHDKNILIFGLGLQGGGVSASKFFSQISQNIIITDLKNEQELQPSLKKIKNISFKKRFGRHKKQDIYWADIIIFNQDIFNKAPNSPYLKLAQNLKKEVTTEIGLFFRFCSCPIIGITGSRGKTTTTQAISSLLKKAGKKIFTGGNIPQSQNLANVQQTTNLDFAVLELSNFQLHGLSFEKKSPHIAVVTSISPDHLASYKNMQSYILDKTIISQFQNNNDFLIINKNIKYFKDFTQISPAKITFFKKNTLPQNWQLKIPGIHNRENLAAAYLVGKILNLDDNLIKQSITNFSGVPFRQEKIAKIKGTTFINDTTASTPTAAEIALKSYPSQKIIWIAGGNSKSLPLKNLCTTAKNNVKNYVFLKGTGTQKLINLLKKSDPQFETKNLGKFSNFEKAIKKSFKSAKKGDYILLSPAFTSFAMFNNEFERGEQFNQIVKSFCK